ncbi:MAG TPA: hypothetical protein VEF76_04715 [Patescibacteria group bacterium]|nr:hypothetical protein [Patescibacteria group bacterium]
MTDSNAKLDALCRHMLQNQRLVASGKLQVISLAKIKRRAGKNWTGLSALVFSAVDSVLPEVLSAPDLSIHYRDETYVLLLAQDEPDTAAEKAREIARRVTARLFDSGDAALRGISEGEAITAESAQQYVESGAGDADPVLQPPVTEVGTTLEELERLEAYNDGLRYQYQPIWEVKRDAVTSFLCLPQPAYEAANPLDGYRQFFAGRSFSDIVDLDLKVISRVRRDLLVLQKENKQTMIVCPIHYDTLYREESFQKFIHRCAAIPEALRKFLILMIEGCPKTYPVRGAFWFAPKLGRKLCRAVYVNMPANFDATLPAWREDGIDGLGYIVDPAMPEETTMQELDRFCSQAQRRSLRTAVMNVATLSLASISVGFSADYLSGPIVSDSVDNPTNMYRFRYDSIYAQLK